MSLIGLSVLQNVDVNPTRLKDEDWNRLQFEEENNRAANQFSFHSIGTTEFKRSAKNEADKPMDTTGGR